LTPQELRPITYQLNIQLSQSSSLQIGKFGLFNFPAGHYIYTGSARRNLGARVARHLKLNKTLRWHIDYLLASPFSSIESVTLFSEMECEINQRVNGVVLIAGFGASDCRANCGSHLKYLGNNSTYCQAP
jgi:Uri superfamily endonuclease